MSGITTHALQQGIYGALTADTMLTAIVSGIYDRVPEDAAYPFLSFGEVEARALPLAGIVAERVTVELEGYSQNGSRSEINTILARVHTLLHDAALTMPPGYALSYLRVSASRASLENDGLTWRGIVTLEAVVEKE